MLRLFLPLLSCFIFLPAKPQSPKAFNAADYPAEKYAVLQKTYTFKQWQVELVNISAKTPARSCAAWVQIKENGQVKDFLHFDDCEALGGCSGLFAVNQPVPDYFIVTKYGGYDGKIILIDESGKIQSYIGGDYSLSADNRYLFSTYSSDISGATVFDLKENKVLFSQEFPNDYVAQFHILRGNYFAVVAADVKKNGVSDILTFDFSTARFVKSTVSDGYISASQILKTYNGFTYPPCDCGVY